MTNIGDYPGIAINLPIFNKLDSYDRRAVLFHEMLHHLGYFHTFDQRFDVVDNAVSCCFPNTFETDEYKKLNPRVFGNKACRNIVRFRHGFLGDQR